MARRQLRAAGWAGSAIDRRIAGGRLIVMHPGVYAVGHKALRPEGYRMAAVLAGGPGAVLSHRDAAAAWGIRRNTRPRTDITVTSGRPRSRLLDVHRSRLHPADRTTLDGVPITTVARTLLDLAEVVPRDHLDRALDEAVRKDLYDGRALDATLQRATGRRGAKPLRASLDALRPEAGATRTELELRALKALAGLEKPDVNVWLQGHEVDLLWRHHRLVVELDSHAFHSTPADFERDRRKAAELQAAGFTVLRFTWRHVTHEPDWVARTVARALAP